MKKAGRASLSAIVQAFAELSEEEYGRLTLIATKLLKQEAYMHNGLELHDLINDATVKLLDGERGWFFKRRSLYHELARIMYSDSNHRHEHFHEVTLKVRRHESYQEGPCDDSLDGLERNVVAPGPARLEPEAIVEREHLAAVLGEVVSDDPQAIAVISAHLRGLKGKEIQRDLDLTPRQYEAVMKRIKYHARQTDVAEDLR